MVDKEHPCPVCKDTLIPLYKSDRRIAHAAVVCLGCNRLFVDTGGSSDSSHNRYDTLVEIKSKEAKRTFYETFQLKPLDDDKPILSQLPERIRDVVNEAKQDPDFRAQSYFERVFYWAFSEGYCRAYAFFRHKFKEGRIRRMRKLFQSVHMTSPEAANFQIGWSGQADVMASDSSSWSSNHSHRTEGPCIVQVWDAKAYQEMKSLLNM